MSNPPRILDPRGAPVISTDAHLPPLPDAAMLAPALRLRMAALQGERFVPEIAGDGRLFERAPAAASVLVPLVQRGDGLHLLLTQRTAHLRDHAGQISFPGGRAEPEDADATATALREAEEEVGLPAHRVEVLGCLPVYTTVTQFIVTPVVGLVSPPFDLKLDAGEVETAFEVPLAFLMNPAHHQRHAVEIQGQERRFLSMPWRDANNGREYFIWGATAAMIRNLYRALVVAI
jgi:8-oxo-dGTP pyrophosphatase MutT (NUDIX family)